MSKKLKIGTRELYVPALKSGQVGFIPDYAGSLLARVRRIPGAGPIAAGRGLEITLTVDEAPFGGAGGILLASVLDRFFAKYDGAVRIEINDAGATPGSVQLRLEQAVEALGS